MQPCDRISTHPIWHYRTIAVITTLLFGGTAWAQEADKTFSVNHFQPSPGPVTFFNVEAPELGDDLKPFVGLTLAYMHKPFVIFNCDVDDNCGEEVGAYRPVNAVENLMVMDVLASFNFLKRLGVGLALPFNVWQRGDTFEVVTNGDTGGQWLAKDHTYTNIFVMGDLRLHLKVRIVGKEGKDGPMLSASVIPTLPIAAWAGWGDGYAGDGFMTITAPRLLFGYRVGAFRSAINIGVLWREKSEFFSAQTGHSLTYGAALGYSIIPEVEILAEIYGSKSFVSENFSDMESSPLLFLGGGRFRAKDFVFSVAGGGGIISGIGVPQFQVIAGAGWAPMEEKKKEEKFEITEWDVDGDGIDNDADECKDQPEDLDGFQDEDGCPDTDNDNDGTPDGYDSCPNEPEDKDGFRDDDGCPDLDHDEDGIKEPNDKCPDKAEDFDGFEDEDGCPEDDNDKDDLADAQDDCPDHAEDVDSFQDEDGCPDLDNDNDGVPDATDKCPDKPETLNGVKDEDGCPDKGKTLVVVTEDRIEIKEMIQFETGSAKIKGDKSFEVLDIVGKVLAGNTAVRVSIEGHTDSKGNADKNRALSKERAESVKTYLAGKGVAADRLETVGWGPDKPIASNRTNAGKKANRRVEFVIIKPEKTVMSTDAPADGGEGGGMDFTSEGGDAEGGGMDFTIEEDAPAPEPEMDFTAAEEEGAQ